MHDHESLYYLLVLVYNTCINLPLPELPSLYTRILVLTHDPDEHPKKHYAQVHEWFSRLLSLVLARDTEFRGVMGELVSVGAMEGVVSWE